MSGNDICFESCLVRDWTPLTGYGSEDDYLTIINMPYVDKETGNVLIRQYYLDCCIKINKNHDR